MKLQELQQQFSDYLYNRGVTADDLTDALYSNGPVDPNIGLKTYSGNLVYAAVGALKDSYPIIEQVISEQNFKFFARNYLMDSPSTSPDLGCFSKQFAPYIGSRDELASIPWLADLAIFEWKWEQLELGFGDFTDTSKYNPHLNPTFAMLKTEHSVLKIWSEFDRLSEEDFENIHHPQYLVFSNSNGKNQVEEIEFSLFKFLNRLACNSSGTEPTIANEVDPIELDSYEDKQMFAYALNKSWIKP